MGTIANMKKLSGEMLDFARALLEGWEKAGFKGDPWYRELESLIKRFEQEQKK